MNTSPRLTAIEQFLQREDDELLYVPDGEGLPPVNLDNICSIFGIPFTLVKNTPYHADSHMYVVFRDVHLDANTDYSFDLETDI